MKKTKQIVCLLSLFAATSIFSSCDRHFLPYWRYRMTPTPHCISNLQATTMRRTPFMHITAHACLKTKKHKKTLSIKSAEIVSTMP